MLDIKETLAKMINFVNMNKIRTASQSGTSNAQGAVRLSNVPNDSTVLAVTVTGGTNVVNLYGLPFKYNNRDWYASIVDWQNLNLVGNRAVTLKIWYIVGGVLLNSIFKAFSHLQEIGGGVNAGHKETVSENAELDKSTVHNSLRNGLWKQPELKHSHNSTDSEWLYVCLLGISKLIRMGRVRISRTCRQDNNKAMVSFVQSEWHEQSYARLGAICKDICVTSERGWAAC